MVHYSIHPSYLGSICELRSMDNSTLMRGTVTEITDGSLTVSQSDETNLILPYNQKIKVNIHNNRLGFLSVIGTVFTSTKEIVKLIELVELSHFEKRFFFRVNVSISALVSLPQEDESLPPADTHKVRVENISLNGLLFSGNVEFDVGDVVNISVYTPHGLLKFTCTVRRTLPAAGSSPPKYGCEFDKYSDKIGDALWRYILQVESDEIRKLRGS